MLQMVASGDRTTRPSDEFAELSASQAVVIRTHGVVGAPGGYVFAARAETASDFLQVMKACARLEVDARALADRPGCEFSFEAPSHSTKSRRTEKFPP
jgi:hypothetical protein